MTYSKQRLREVTALKRKAVRRIQTDIGTIDASPSRKYIKEFNDEFKTYHSVCQRDEVLLQASAADLIWVGDYHALPASQAYVVELLRQLTPLCKDLALAVEPVFARNQNLLDLWMAGAIDEREFLDRIRYYEEWGCDWDGYKAIFDVARQLRIPVYGVDCHPRSDMRSIGRRDLGVARCIVRLLEQKSGQTLVVVFGESHLASSHLPGLVQRIFKRKGVVKKEILVLQNIDALYWKLQERGEGEASSVRLREGVYCVFNATPIEKYESFRRYLHQCTEEDSFGDWTLLAQTLEEVMMSFLDLKKTESVIGSMPAIDGIQ